MKISHDFISRLTEVSKLMLFLKERFVKIEDFKLIFKLSKFASTPEKFMFLSDLKILIPTSAVEKIRKFTVRGQDEILHFYTFFFQLCFFDLQMLIFRKKYLSDN